MSILLPGIDYGPAPFPQPEIQPPYFPGGEYQVYGTSWFHLQCPRCGFMIQMTCHGSLHSPRNCPHCDHPIMTKDVNDAFRPPSPTINLTPCDPKINIVWPGVEDTTTLADGLYRVANGEIKKIE